MEEKVMRKKIIVSVVAVGMLISAGAYSIDGRSFKARSERPLKYEILAQLPEEKEMLFHQIMREVRQETANIRGQIRDIRTEIESVLTAPAFNEDLFREKTKRVHELHGKVREVRENAIVELAKQFTPEERLLLAKLIPNKRGYRGGPRMR
jgi:uncharacterized membrane protein